jgi:isopropylmalate/homocitrate/citramalate synthase
LQVLVQAREDLIERTVESLIGAKKVIIHMYNSTSPAQRRVVFGKSKDEIKAIAVKGAQMIKDRLHRLKGHGVTLQYSPESFSATEVEFAKEISEAVMDVWQPTPQRKMILNLPDTVEVAMPNVYADQIEWICRNIKKPRRAHHQPAHAQRPRHRHRRDGAGPAGRRGSRRRHAVRQWRAHRQSRHRDRGVEPLHARH